jgi:hypothetical protein
MPDGLRRMGRFIILMLGGDMINNLDQIDWNKLDGGTGTAYAIPRLLRDLISTDEAKVSASFDSLVKTVLNHDTHIEIKLATIPFLIDIMRLPVTKLHARLALLLGALAESSTNGSFNSLLVEKVRLGMPVYLKLAEGSRKHHGLELALQYLLAHFPADKERIHAVFGNAPDCEGVTSLERCLSQFDYENSVVVARIGLAWPSPSLWHLTESEAEGNRRWRESLNLTRETVTQLWNLETQAILAYMGSQAENIIERTANDRGYI